MDIQGRADLYWPTRYENWPNASIKGIDSISPASRVPLSLCAARKDFVPALGRLTQLLEQPRENRLNYVLPHVCLKYVALQFCATCEIVLFTYSATEFYYTNIRRPFFTVDRLYRHAFDPILNFICDMWHNLKRKINQQPVIFVRYAFWHERSSYTLYTDDKPGRFSPSSLLSFLCQWQPGVRILQGKMLLTSRR